ncbi:hypothetical protein [Aeoliella sp.]|uniref:hypothetical protein n=1 Tax=Aeoliella sp. TaxID=2795800 RepID=UPI003CCBFAB4
MRIAIFRNEPKEEGDRVRFSGKLTRSYQDAAGKWHDTEYLSGVDYLKAANLMQEAYNTERELRQAEQSTAPESSGPA